MFNKSLNFKNILTPKFYLKQIKFFKEILNILKIEIKFEDGPKLNPYHCPNSESGLLSEGFLGFKPFS